MASRPANVFPFSAIVGQDLLKAGLLLNAVDHRVGGVLIRGEKGTAKSTAVRALAAVLPDIEVVSGCRFGCDPGDPGSWCVECRERRDDGRLPKERRAPRVVDLPVSATEDRLVGTLDFQKALREGERVFQPGLLADANRGILYVDEVNLLDDHLVDTLLDAAAMGVNSVEREGVSFAHPARFILVGTMNPEEGEVRPQLLDRFGLCVEVEAMRDPHARVEIVRRRRDFEDAPEKFSRRWEEAEEQQKLALADARRRLPQIEMTDEVLYAIADLCIRAGVDGHRADTVMARAACAYAALDGRTEVELIDVEKVAPLVLAHRLRKVPFEEVRSDLESLRESLRRAVTGEGDANAGDSAPVGPGQGQASIFESTGTPSDGTEIPLPVSATLETELDGTRRTMGGRRQQTVTDGARGRYRRSEIAPVSRASDVAFDATIRAAASSPGTPAEGLAIDVREQDLRKKVRTRKVGASIVFCVDASGSMGASKRIEAAKAAVLDLLVDAYQRRDRVSLVSFRGDSADVVLAPTGSVELANLKLRSLPTGGATPLAHGIMKSLELIAGELRRQPDTVPWLVLVTDGRANVGLDGGMGSEDAKVAAARVKAAGVHAVVIDTTSGTSTQSAARDIARVAGADYVRVQNLDGAAIVGAVRSRL